MRTLPLAPLLAALFTAPLPSPTPSASAPTLESLAWIAGHWRTQGGRQTTEEIWLPPRAGLMLGLNRSWSEGKKARFEYLRIESNDQGVVYLASPSGTKPTPFRLTKSEKGLAVFENPEHDFPKKIEYRLDGEKLIASIAGDKPGPAWTLVRVAKVD